MPTMKKIKILFHADCNQDTIQAQMRDAITWAMYLDPRKFQAYIFATGTPHQKIVNLNHVTIIRLPNGNKITNLLSTLKLWYHYLTNRYDAAIMSRVTHIELRYLELRKQLFDRKKVLWAVAGPAPLMERGRWADAIINKTDQVFAISTKLQEQIEKRYGVKAPVAHLCYDMELFRPRKKENKRKKVICVGTLSCSKQPFTFASIASETPEADFTWIGGGLYLDLLLEKKDREHINNLQFVGSLSQIDVARLLSDSDVFIYPVYHAGFPNVVVEAMASGLPVITLNNYGPEAVIDGQTGYVVTSEFDMLRKLRLLLQDEQLLSIFSKNARKRALAYAGENVIGELEKAIENAVHI